ncbi:hypothetical protein ILYODFUR_038879 [Ilyodon furcidens]|uniref:Uncharacterized protein n=1 Tax=Ilyodon furcidens TaxID=33524 RepID=A0ABV0U196_9TELE
MSKGKDYNKVNCFCFVSVLSSPQQVRAPPTLIKTTPKSILFYLTITHEPGTKILELRHLGQRLAPFRGGNQVQTLRSCHLSCFKLSLKVFACQQNHTICDKQIGTPKLPNQTNFMSSW